jgi:hypothetical protein
MTDDQLEPLYYACAWVAVAASAFAYVTVLFGG